jgi:hypothetical protein
MQKNETQTKLQEKISFGGLMMTMAISNVAVLIFLTPYT